MLFCSVSHNKKYAKLIQLSLIQGYQVLHNLADIIKSVTGELKAIKVREKTISLSVVGRSNQMLDYMFDGGFILIDNKQALAAIGHSHLLEKTDTLKIGQTEFSIKGQYSHLDKYIDSIGVEAFDQEGGHLASNWNYEAPPGERSVVYFENIEYLDASYDKHMHLKRAKVMGELITNCNIAGTPSVKAYFSIPDTPDDLSFHRSTIGCRRSLINEKVMEFTPPNGITSILGYS